jgi:hypothetical protein
MRSSTKGALAAAAFAFLSGSAFGQAWSDDFDSYNVGDTIPSAGTAPWGAPNNNDWELWVSNLPFNIVEATFAQSGANSLHVTNGTDLVANWAASAGGAPSMGNWEFRAFTYFPSTVLGEQFWIMLNTYNFGGPFSWSVQVHMEPGAGTVRCDCQGMNPANPVPLLVDQWVELLGEIDLNNDAVELWYGGTPLTTGPYTWTGTVFGGGAGNLEIQALDVYPAGATTDDIFWDTISLQPEVGVIGTNYCGPAVPNSTGSPAVMDAFGSATAAANNVDINVTGVPVGQFGYFINSQVQGFVNPINSNGFLCLAGSIGRHNQPGLIGTGPAFGITLDTTSVPTPTGFVAINAGETWNFQSWYRDIGNTNNFSDGVSITFN